uniref:Uncharacterized protein n=1 Tax=Sphaerodactylus townsendi TaxID=933632 RepID=A0ACB8FZD6_9SAUR
MVPREKHLAREESPSGQSTRRKPGLSVKSAMVFLHDAGQPCFKMLLGLVGKSKPAIVLEPGPEPADG